MKIYVIIKGDMNDGDYTMSKNKIAESEIPIIEKVASLLKKNRFDHNWPTYDGSEEDPSGLYLDTNLLTEEEFDFFDDLTPYGEFGIHSIVSVEILYVDKELILM